MNITAVSKTHETVIIVIIVAAAVFLLARQIYRMIKQKDSGCSCCSKSKDCSMKDDKSRRE